METFSCRPNLMERWSLQFFREIYVNSLFGTGTNNSLIDVFLFNPPEPPLAGFFPPTRIASLFRETWQKLDLNQYLRHMLPAFFREISLPSPITFLYAMYTHVKTFMALNYLAKNPWWSRTTLSAYAFCQPYESLYGYVFWEIPNVSYGTWTHDHLIKSQVLYHLS